MSENQEHFRHILLFYYKKGKNVTQFAEKICSVYREDATTRQAAIGFIDFEIKILMSNMHIILVDSLQKMSKSSKKIEENRHVSSCDITKKLNIDI